MTRPWALDLSGEARTPASLDTPRGWLWVGAVAAVFVFMSNPLVFFPTFRESLPKALLVTAVAVILTFPWLRVPRPPWPWLLFLGWCALSATWSIAPDVTLRGTLLYVQISAVAFVIGANCAPKVIAWGLALGGVLVVGLSVHAYEARLPGAYYPYIDEPLFTGIGMNQNILAYTLAVSLAGCLAVGPPSGAAARLAWSVVTVVNLVGIHLADSGAGRVTALALVATAVTIAVRPFLGTLRRRHAWLASATALVVFGAVLSTSVVGLQLGTVSGRAPFWEATLETTWRSPWLGSGWAAVWEHPWNHAPFNPVVEEIYTRAGYTLTHGHNFFVDPLPEIGFVGVLVVVAMIVHAVRRARAMGVTHGAPDPTGGRLVVLVLVALLVFGITEPMLTVPLGWWAFATVASVGSLGPPSGSAPNEGPRTRPGRHRLTRSATRGSVANP